MAHWYGPRALQYDGRAGLLRRQPANRPRIALGAADARPLVLARQHLGCLRQPRFRSLASAKDYPYTPAEPPIISQWDEVLNGGLGFRTNRGPFTFHLRLDDAGRGSFPALSAAASELASLIWCRVKAYDPALTQARLVLVDVGLRISRGLFAQHHIGLWHQPAPLA